MMRYMNNTEGEDVRNTAICPEINVRVSDEEAEFKEKFRIFVEKKREREKTDVRLQGLIYSAYNDAIKKMIFGKGSLDIFNKINITKEAYDKMNLIARRTVTITGDYNEIYMELINKDNADRMLNSVIRDVYILKGQRIQPAYCGETDFNSKRESIKEIKEQGNYILGWGHSHGDFGTHFSGPDKDNIKASVPGRSKIILTPKPFENSKREFIFNFMPSIVVNAKDSKPAISIGIQYPKLEIGKDFVNQFYLNEKPKFNVIGEKNDIEMRQDVIDKQILERVLDRDGNKFEKRDVIPRLSGLERKDKKLTSYLIPRERDEKPEFSEKEELTPLAEIMYGWAENENSKEQVETMSQKMQMYEKEMKEIRKYIEKSENEKRALDNYIKKNEKEKEGLKSAIRRQITKIKGLEDLLGEEAKRRLMKLEK